jgi:hypothetical protein
MKILRISMGADGGPKVSEYPIGNMQVWEAEG